MSNEKDKNLKKDLTGIAESSAELRLRQRSEAILALTEPSENHSQIDEAGSGRVGGCEDDIEFDEVTDEPAPLPVVFKLQESEKSVENKKSKSRAIPLNAFDASKDKDDDLSTLTPDHYYQNGNHIWGQQSHGSLLNDTASLTSGAFGNQNAAPAVTRPGAVSVQGTDPTPTSSERRRRASRDDDLYDVDPMDLERSMTTAIAISDEDLEREVRQRILRDAVQAEVEQYPEGNNSSEDDQDSRQKLYRAAFVVLVVAIVGIVIAVVVTRGGSGDEPLAVPTTSPSPAPVPVPTTSPTLAPTMVPTTVPERILTEFLAARSFDGGEALRSNGSPQRSAFLFLLDYYNDLTFDEHLIDLYVLLTLFHSTQGFQWIRRENWYIFGLSVCDWDGIECQTVDNQTDDNGRRAQEAGFISEITMSDNSLFGYLPPEIGMLGSRLVTLDLSDNNLMGELPESFSLLTNLQLFDISGNQCDGFIPRTICDAGGQVVVDCDKVHCTCCTPDCPTSAPTPSIPSELSTTPTHLPSRLPFVSLTSAPTTLPTQSPVRTKRPSPVPTNRPSMLPTLKSTKPSTPQPTRRPTRSPSAFPTRPPPPTSNSDQNDEDNGGGQEPQPQPGPPPPPAPAPAPTASPPSQNNGNRQPQNDEDRGGGPEPQSRPPPPPPPPAPAPTASPPSQNNGNRQPQNNEDRGGGPEPQSRPPPPPPAPAPAPTASPPSQNNGNRQPQNDEDRGGGKEPKSGPPPPGPAPAANPPSQNNGNRQPQNNENGGQRPPGGRGGRNNGGDGGGNNGGDGRGGGGN